MNPVLKVIGIIAVMIAFVTGGVYLFKTQVAREKFVNLPKDPDTGLIFAKPTIDDPLMNQMNPVLKVTPPVYTPEEHTEVENILNKETYTEGTAEADSMKYYNTAFSRNFYTEPSDDLQAIQDFLGYNRVQPDFFPDKIYSINSFNY